MVEYVVHLAMIPMWRWVGQEWIKWVSHCEVFLFILLLINDDDNNNYDEDYDDDDDDDDDLTQVLYLYY